MSSGTNQNNDAFWYTVFRAIALSYLVIVAVYNFINWDQFLPVLEQSWGLTLVNSPVVNLFYIMGTTNSILYPGVGRIFFAILLLSGILAVFVISKGRTILETLQLCILFMIPRPRYYWGRITDRLTGDAIPFSRIEIRGVDIDTNQESYIKDTVADMFGSYRISFAAEANHKYVLVVLNSDYEPYIKHIQQDRPGSVSIYSNIQLTPKNLHASIWQQVLFKLKTWLNNNMVGLLYMLSIISFLFIVPGTIANTSPSTLVYCALSILTVVWNTYVYFLYNEGYYGKFILVDTGQPAADLLISLLHQGKQIASAVTGRTGEVNFNVAPGTYAVEIRSAGVLLAEATADPTVEVTNKGFLSRNVYVKKVTGGHSSPSGLINPFAN